MKRVAIIGGGISGLTTAYLLSQKHQVKVFEKNDYIGGHTATVDVEVGGQEYAIDTGFIVFNDKTYPNFLRLLDQIGVDKQPTEMSFSVANPAAGFEYNGHNLNSLFAQRSNIFKPSFWSLIRQILKFNKLCKSLYQEDDFRLNWTLGDFLKRNNFSEYFSRHYILPMGAAIWSTSLKQMEAFELKFFVQFFYHHGLLNITDRPQWYVIPGGSRSYIKPLTASFKDHIQLNTDLISVSRYEEGVMLHFSTGKVEQFDEVVFACHSDQALALLSDATVDECKVLKAMPYSRNEVVLHYDEQLLPQNKLAWASWNYRLTEDDQQPACVTYNMNILQGLKADTTFCVTLNQSEGIAKSKVLREFVYEHPVFSAESIKAQSKRDLICGKNNTHFAGAYWYSGFHEDGVRSAVDVAQRFGVTL